MFILHTWCLRESLTVLQTVWQARIILTLSNNLITVSSSPPSPLKLGTHLVPEPPHADDLRGALIEAVIAAADERSLLRTDLAFNANLSPKHVSRLLTGRESGSLASWQKLLDVLDLQVTLQSRE